MSKHKKHDHEEHMDESWLIPYADLLTLLLALFIVLFATAKNLDMKKVEQIQKVFQAIISGGESVFKYTSPVTASKEQKTKNRNSNETLTVIVKSPAPTVKEETKQNKDEKKEDNKESSTPVPTVNPEGTPAPSSGGQEGDKDKKFKEEQKQLEDMKKEIDKFIKDQKLNAQLQTSLNKQQLLITIRDQALFGAGSADLKPQSVELAKQISAMLATHQSFQIRIGGHTDNQPINSKGFASNWDLSSKRAINFLQALLINKTIDPAMYSATGFAEYHPISENKTNEGRAKNRRVEISIMRNFVDNNGTIQERQ